MYIINQPENRTELTQLVKVTVCHREGEPCYRGWRVSVVFLRTPQLDVSLGFRGCWERPCANLNRE